MIFTSEDPAAFALFTNSRSLSVRVSERVTLATDRQNSNAITAARVYSPDPKMATRMIAIG